MKHTRHYHSLRYSLLGVLSKTRSSEAVRLFYKTRVSQENRCLSLKGGIATVMWGAHCCRYYSWLHDQLFQPPHTRTCNIFCHVRMFITFLHAVSFENPLLNGTATLVMSTAHSLFYYPQCRSVRTRNSSRRDSDSYLQEQIPPRCILVSSTAEFWRVIRLLCFRSALLRAP